MKTADLADALGRNIDAVVQRLLPVARRSGGFWHVGNLAGEPGGSLYVHRHGARAGKWTDAATDEYGDGLDLVWGALGTDLHGACEWAQSFLGLGGNPSTMPRRLDGQARKRHVEDEAQIAQRVRFPRRLLGECRSIAGTEGADYLASRGLRPRPGIGFHPSCPHPDGFRAAAMVVPVRHIARGIVAAHCTFLANGRKAKIERPKIMYGPVGGGAVHFGEPSPDRWLAVAEGVETTLAVAQASELPAWAALSAHGIEKLILPPTAPMVVICADNDANGTGQHAAREAGERWLREGRRVKIALPPEQGTDFNDILRGTAASHEEADHVAA